MTYKAMLSEAQRAELLQKLAELAPDDILLDTMRDVTQFRERVLDDLKKLAIKPPAQVRNSRTTAEAGSAPRQLNIEPAGDIAQRVSPKIIEKIVNILKVGPASADSIAVRLKSSVPNTTRVLKALWIRSIVAYDDAGQIYSLRKK